MIQKLGHLIKLLEELSENTGDARGRDGAYLADCIAAIRTLAESVQGEALNMDRQLEIAHKLMEDVNEQLKKFALQS